MDKQLAEGEGRNRWWNCPSNRRPAWARSASSARDRLAGFV